MNENKIKICNYLFTTTKPNHIFTLKLLCLSGLNLMEGKLNKKQWQGSLQNLMMPKLNESLSKADPTIVYITSVIAPCNLVLC